MAVAPESVSAHVVLSTDDGLVVVLKGIRSWEIAPRADEFSSVIEYTVRINEAVFSVPGVEVFEAPKQSFWNQFGRDWRRGHAFLTQTLRSIGGGS